MYPFVPFWVPCRIAVDESVSMDEPAGLSGDLRFLVLGLEDTDHLALAVPGKITSRTALGDHLGVHALLDGHPDAFYHIVELQFCHPPMVNLRIKRLSCRGAHAFRRLEYRMMNLQLLLFICFALDFMNLELGRYFVCPSL
jgi:hypothetical protein